MRYDRARKNLDRHHNYIRAAYMASGTCPARARSPTGPVSYYDWGVEIHRSARKHLVSDDDIREAGEHPLVGYNIADDRPERELRLGFDTAGRLLEIVVLILDDGTELAIHAMKARPQYLDLLP